MADSHTLSREISPPPYATYGSHDEKGGGTLKINLVSSPPPPEMIILSPSVPESVTANTDDEAYPANASPEPIGANIEYSPNNNNRSDTDSPRSEGSYSYEESKIEVLVKQQEAAKKSQPNQYSALARPANLPPKTPRDDDFDDEIFDRLLMNYQRQESSSRDKRRSESFKHGHFSLRKQKSPSKKLSHKLPKIKDTFQEPPSTVTRHGTRGRRAETHQPVVPSPSLSGSTFKTLRHCNEINSQVPLPTHIEKWPSITETEEPTPSPSPLPNLDNRIKSSPYAYDFQDEQKGDVVGVPEDMNIDIIGGPSFMDTAKSTPNVLANSNTSIAELRVHTKPQIAHISSSSVSVNYADYDNQNNDFYNNHGSMTPNFERQRRSTINPRRSRHTPVISRGFSESEVFQGVHSKDVNIKPDVENMDSGSDDDDDDVFSMEEEEINIDQKQSALALQTTTQALMVSCGDSKEVFQSLWKICTSLKKDPTYQISFDDKILKYDHVESFLKLLGFLKNKDKKEWVCFAHTRVRTSLIDTAILECHKCRQTIQERQTTIKLVQKRRKNSFSKRGAVTGNGIASPPPPSNNNQSKPPILNLSIQPLSIVQQSKSYEESHIYSDDEDDNKDDSDSVQLYELIWGITHNNNEDPVAKEVLLLCYPLVTTAKYILYCLEARFFNDDHDGRITMSNVSNGSSNDSPSSATLGSHVSFPSFDGSGLPTKTHMRQSSSIEFNKGVKYDKILSSFSVQAKVIEFVRQWMARYWDKDWDTDAKLMSYCKVFMRRIRKAYQSEANEQYYEPLEVAKGLRLVGMLEQTIKTQKSRKQMRLNKILGDESSNHLLSPRNNGKSKGNSKHKKSVSKSFFNRSISQKKLYGSKGPKDLMDVNYVVIAEQTTLLQFNLFKKIHPRECLKQSWKNKDRKHIDAPNITQYIDAFNRLTKWIQSSILVASNVKTRGRIIKKWVKVEEELYKLRNFQAICAVYCALASSPIYRLKDAWSYVPKKHITQHDMIKVIMKSTGNWKNLRRLQLETHPPMLPYFGMFAQDLIVIEETTNNRANDGSINWDALWRVNTAIDKHLIYQNSPYNNLDSDASIQRWMNKELTMSGKLDDEWVYKVSDNVVLKDKRELGKDIKPNLKTSPKKRTMSFFKSK